MLIYINKINNNNNEIQLIFLKKNYKIKSFGL